MRSRAANVANKLLRGTLDGDIPRALRAEIEAYLDNRHVVGDRERIIIGVQAISSEDPKELPGFTVVETPASWKGRDGETHPYINTDVTYPEAGPTRLYDGWGTGIVVPICGRLWRVSYFPNPSQGGYDTFPTADGSQLVFEQVPEGTEESEFTPWDPKEAAREYLQGDFDRADRDLRETIDAYARFRAGTQKFESRKAYWVALDKALDAGATADECPEQYMDEEQAEYHETEGRARLMEHLEKARVDLKNMDCALKPPKYLAVFGQPHFIQREYYPAHKGRPGMNLVCIDTDHGDSGNQNLLFAVDEDGYPVAAWFESSSC